MPELPEVEVLRRSLERAVLGARLGKVSVRARALREPLRRAALERLVSGRRIVELRRRAKYLCIDLERGSTLVVHLGMSGRLTVEREGAASRPHEHVVIGLEGGRELRFRDPRRFGLVFAVPSARLAVDEHFAHLGVEPLSEDLDGRYLSAAARGRSAPIKSFLMDAGVVVGVGNIYASESLYRAGLHPRRAAGRISARRLERLALAVKEVLEEAILQGGTTLNDFADADGEPGYFAVSLEVYGREGEPCRRCGATIRRIVQGNRSTFYCPRCQR